MQAKKKLLKKSVNLAGNNIITTTLLALTLHILTQKTVTDASGFPDDHSYCINLCRTEADYRKYKWCGEKKKTKQKTALLAHMNSETGGKNNYCLKFYF